MHISLNRVQLRQNKYPRKFIGLHAYLNSQLSHACKIFACMCACMCDEPEKDPNLNRVLRRESPMVSYDIKKSKNNTTSLFYPQGAN